MYIDFSDSVVRHLIKITTKTEEMVPITSNTPKSPFIPTEFPSQIISTEFAPTGFGRLPEPCISPKRFSPHRSHLLTILLTLALILCLIGVIYLLIFVTITFNH